MFNYENFNSKLKRLGIPLWERLYMVGIRYKDTLSLEEIKAFGMPTTGNKQYDQVIHNELVDRYITIDKMVEYHKNGISFYIRNHKETKEIYELISNYLVCWKEYLENGINIGGAPIDDLIALDRLASKIYDHAVEHFTPTFINSNLIRYMEQNKLGRSSFERPVEAIRVNGEEEVKKHDSLASLFSERVFGR